MQNKFCKALSNAVSFRIPGDKNILTFNPCCLFDNYLPFHPTFFNRTKKQFEEATDFLPACSKCKLKEQTHGTSLRYISNMEIPDGIGNDIYKLEVVLDTTCNAACIQCNSDQSSLWRKEVADESKKKIMQIQPESQIDERIKQILSVVDINKVKVFHFWGGEPLVTDTHLKFLTKIEDPSSVVLKYTTNTSIFPKEDVLELWSKFKSVQLNLSMDGIEDRFHYIRYPLSWEKVTRNLQRFKTEAPSNINYHVNCCIIPLNVYYINELGDWISENFNEVNGRKVTYNFIRGESTLDVAKTPMALREAVWKKLPENHDVSNVLKELPVVEHLNMLRYLDIWDRHRGLDWKKVFPDIVKYFI